MALSRAVRCCSSCEMMLSMSGILIMIAEIQGVHRFLRSFFIAIRIASVLDYPVSLRSLASPKLRRTFSIDHIQRAQDGHNVLCCSECQFGRKALTSGMFGMRPAMEQTQFL